MNVYDFDNTIYDGESGVDLFLFFLKKDPSLLLKLPWGIKLIVNYKMTKVPLQEILDKYTPLVEQYGAEHVGDLDELAVEFWNTHSYKFKSFYFAQRTDDDLIITACLDFIMEEACKRLGVKNFIASGVNKEHKTLKSFCYRENKVKAFREQYPDEMIENLYTDSFNDQPLMEISKNVFLVKGNRITKIK